MSPERTWVKVSETEWYGPGWGTVSKRPDGWWGSNSTSPDVDVDPVVGPYGLRGKRATRSCTR